MPLSSEWPELYLHVLFHQCFSYLAYLFIYVSVTSEVYTKLSGCVRISLNLLPFVESFGVIILRQWVGSASNPVVHQAISFSLSSGRFIGVVGNLLCNFVFAFCPARSWSGSGNAPSLVTCTPYSEASTKSASNFTCLNSCTLRGRNYALKSHPDTTFHRLCFAIGCINPYPTAFPYGNGMVLHFYQQQESSTTKTVHKVINKGLKTYV